MKTTMQITSEGMLWFVTKDRRAHQFVIQLNFGLISRKTINRVGHIYHVINHIDGSDQEIHEDNLSDRNITNIGEAIDAGAFYLV
jgi:hypothetical protein